MPKPALFPFLAVSLMLAPGVAMAQRVSGAAAAVDGDSLSMTGANIRLYGIDAPEALQTCQRGGEAWACGMDAKRQLAELVAGRQVKCEARDTDVYGRMVSVCLVGSIDVGRTMVEAGLATALPEHASDYVDAEARAKRYKVGIWGSTFETPAAYRAAHPRQAPPRQKAGAAIPAKAVPQRVYRNQFGCAIKGNRNRRGEWIYHLPGMPYYDGTRPEDLFCTEAQAQAAGYRRAIVK